MDLRDLRDVTFGIIGLGLIGGSYAKALHGLKVQHIIGVDTNPTVLLMALDEGYISEGCFTSLEPLKKADVVISTLYPGDLVPFVEKSKRYLREDVLFTDVTGIKADLLEQVDALLGAEADFVSGHPMAGREGKGYGQSAAEIFLNSNYIIVARERNKRENIDFLRDLAYQMGCRHVAEISPAEHDEIIAYTSDLPHLLAVALVNCDSLKENTKYFIAGGFRDATRVADINAQLWADLFLYNRGNVLSQLESMCNQLTKWQEILAQGDRKALLTMLEDAATKRREIFNANHYR